MIKYLNIGNNLLRNLIGNAIGYDISSNCLPLKSFWGKAMDFIREP
jgi:hypothetical protein